MATNRPDPSSSGPTSFGSPGAGFMPRDPIARAGLIGAGVLFFLCGAGWALYGDSIFLQTLAAGIANCF